MTFGPDISHYQGVVDWARVGQACDFAIIKATQGNGGIDPVFATNRAGALAHVKVVGAYHFAVPGDPVAQARHLFSVAGHLPILALDLEEQNPPSTSWRAKACDPQNFASQFLAELHTLSGQTPWIYTGPGFIAEYGINQTAYPLWLAQYGPAAHPAPWAKESIWQYADNGTVPGVPRPCDVNRSDLTVEQLGGTTPEVPEVLDPNDPLVKKILAELDALSTVAVKNTAAIAAVQARADGIKKELDAQQSSWGPHIDKLP